MMRENIAKIIGYPLQDYIKKTDILGTLKFLRESQHWDEGRIRDYQTEKLISLVEFASERVPYYENLFKKIKLKKSDIKSIDDIHKIPILTKEILREKNMELIAKGFNMKYVRKGKTGGTTGPPVLVFKDVQTRSFTWASYYRWYEWMGINYFDKSATFWGARTVLSKSQKKATIDSISRYLQNNVVLNSFEMNEHDLKVVYDRLHSFKPLILKGYLSALLNFASFLEKNDLNEIRPKVISSTTETLLPHNRKYLEDVFNASIFDQYGCVEVSAISYECAQHNGLHVNQEHVICEILNDNLQPIVNETGKVIATDLDNYIMPFIRYENGDCATLSNNKCSCGIKHPLLKSIEGRSIDTITLNNGRSVHGVFFTDILYELGILSNDVQKFQIYQNTPGEIKCRLECQTPLAENKKEQLIKNLMPFFNKVEYYEMKRIENEQNGKYKYIINDL